MENLLSGGGFWGRATSVAINKNKALEEENTRLKGILMDVIEKSERHITTSSEFWVYDNYLRMEIIDILSNE